MWYSLRTSIGDNFGFVSLFCFTLFFSFAIYSHNEAGEGIETVQGTEFSQVDFGSYADFSLTVSRLIHLAYSVLVNRARSISTTVFLGAVYFSAPLSRTDDTLYRLFYRFIRVIGRRTYKWSIVSYAGTHACAFDGNFISRNLG